MAARVGGAIKECCLRITHVTLHETQASIEAVLLNTPLSHGTKRGVPGYHVASLPTAENSLSSIPISCENARLHSESVSA